MAVEDRTRHDRLRALLPRAYATDPADSVLGALIEMLGDRLREADRHLERALRDRWLALAAGERARAGDGDGGDGAGESGAGPGEAAPLPVVDLGGATLPLELLGATLDILRQPWEADHEAYRSRVRILAPLLTRGLATPRVILAVALTSLHSEPCPVLERQDDSTRGWGLPPGALARCRACRGGQVPPPGTPCPLRARAVMDATVTDNPRTRVELRRRRLAPAAGAGEAQVRVRSNSLFSARPQIVLRVPDAPTEGDGDGEGNGAPGDAARVVASFRGLETGEELVVAHPLAPGATLTIRPRSPHDPATPRHRQRWVDRPPGEALAPARAWVTDAQGTVDNLDGQVVFFARGSRFGAARFAGDDDDGAAARFATLATRIEDVDGIELPPGDSTWIYRPLDRAGLAAALTDLDDEAAAPLIDQAPDVPALVPVDLTLTWWTRPPARFRLRIPRTPAVKAVLARGAVDYLRHMIDRVRPVGVQPVLDFAELPFPEPLEPDDALRAVHLRMDEAVDPGDGLARLDSALPAEALAPADQAGFIGIFDVTRFDFSRFSVLTPEPGQFDVTFYDHSLAQDLAREPGTFDRSYFEWADWRALTPGPAALDATYFDNALLAP